MVKFAYGNDLDATMVIQYMWKWYFYFNSNQWRSTV